MVHKMKYEGEDRIGFYTCKEYSIYFLADGHGNDEHGKNDYVASYLKNNFIHYFKPYYSGNQDVTKSLRQSINEIDKNLQHTNDGSTLTGFILKDADIIVFNVGDSRVYAIDKDNKIIQLTEDHNLQCKKEIKRLSKDFGIHKKYYDKRLNGLSMSRSIGDNDVRGRISSPDIQKYSVNEFKYIILASDGLYNCFTNINILKDFIMNNTSITKSVDDIISYAKNNDSTQDDKSILIKRL